MFGRNTRPCRQPRMGLVALNLATRGDAAAAAKDLTQRAQRAGVELDGLLVAKQGPEGLEVVVGAKRERHVLAADDVQLGGEGSPRVEIGVDRLQHWTIGPGIRRRG